MGSTSSKKLPRLVLFGDSLTQYSFHEETQGVGWFMQKWYKGKAEVENEGYAGYTSQHIKCEFRDIIERITRPDATPTLLFTIFLGANDACLVGDSEYCPLPKFEENIREFVETILTQDHLPDTKIVLITPPPINIPDPLPNEDDVVNLGPTAAAAIKALRKDPKKERSYLTYLSKKRYAEKIMQIARGYEETGRVVGLNYWEALVDAGLEDQGRSSDEDKYDEDRLPGCGLATAKRFRGGYFTDGLHLAPLGYNVLSKALLDLTLEKWPELSPDSIGV